MTGPDWTRGVAPVPSTGFVRVSPIAPEATDPANDVNFVFRLTEQFPSFLLSDSTALAIITDASGLTLGNP